MASRVKGIVVEIGGDVTGLDKALSGVNGKIKSTQSQLRDVERLLKLDPTNVTLLEQKQRLLNEAVEDTEEKLDTLLDAEKKVQKQFEKGEASQEQYEGLQREIESTRISLRELEGKARDTAKRINSIDEEPVDDVADAARDAEDALKDAGKEASTFADHLKAEMVADAAGSIVESLKDVAEESKEHRKIMASLNGSSEKAGYAAEETAEAYKKLFGVLGDDQTSATTLANLQALKLPQEKLKELIDGTVGSWAEYGDSIPIDGLAEALNETVKTGQVTGNLADVLNWGAKEGETFGVALKDATEENKAWNDAVSEAKTAEDYFNLALQECATEAERADLILKTMADRGLAASGKAWQENNESLVENNIAQANLQDQLADLGELVEPMFTKITNAVASALEWFNSLDTSTQTMILTIVALLAAIGPLSSAIGGITSACQGVGAAISFLIANPIALLIVAIIALIAVFATMGDDIKTGLQMIDDFLQNIFAKDWTEVFGPGLGEPINAFMRNLKNIWDSIKLIFDGLIDFIRGVFTGDWERAWNGVMSIFEGIFTGLIAIAATPINTIIGLINGAIDGLNLLIDAANNIPGVNIGKIGKIPLLASGGEVIEGEAIVGDGGPELLTVANGRTIVQPLTNNTTNHSTHMGGVVVNVYGAPGQSEDALAERVMEKMQAECDSKGAAL